MEDRAVTIVEEEGMVHNSQIVIEGLPDVGLVGTIAASYIIEKMGYERMGYVESDLFPPVMVIHDGKLHSPFRIYGNEHVIVVLSEVAIPPDAVYPMTWALADWFKSINAELVISVTGLPAKNRIDIEKPEVFAVGNTDAAVEKLKETQMNLLEEGFIAGSYAIMLRECQKRNLNAISLLAQCFPVYPDPGAAASAIEALDKFINVGIDVGELMEREEEIKLKARDLMRETALSAPELQKGVEQDMPIMYR
ncbi:MAG: proteasome assembly chaperone family protein [Halobacteriota archaeon]